MIQYPIEFKSSTSSQAGMNALWASGPRGDELTCAVPPEFEGPGGAFSPEDLFLASLANCFVATFKVYAEHSKLTFEEVRVDSSLLVDLDSRKKPVMKSAGFHVKIRGSSNRDRAAMIAKKASESGFVLNSVKSELSFTFEVS